MEAIAEQLQIMNVTLYIIAAVLVMILIFKRMH